MKTPRLTYEQLLVKMAEDGYIMWLVENGYKYWLVDNGYLSADEIVPAEILELLRKTENDNAIAEELAKPPLTRKHGNLTLMVQPVAYVTGCTDALLDKLNTECCPWASDNGQVCMTAEDAEQVEELQPLLHRISDCDVICTK